MVDAPLPNPVVSRRITILICCALLIFFAICAGLAVFTKSATFDEPVHVAAGWTYGRLHDFRMNPEHPPLWKMWAALPNLLIDLKADLNSAAWRGMPAFLGAEFDWSTEFLYRTPENDGQAMVNRSRIMMLLIGVTLGGVIAWWSWRLGGGVAAITAVGLFSFDPNFLAHAPLVTNDVALTLVLVALMFSVWRIGQRVTWGNAIALALLCGAGLNVKFSALLFGPMVVLALIIRALMPQSWIFFGRILSTRAKKMAAAIGICAGALFISWVMIWAVYDFRFSPTPDPAVRLNTPRFIEMARRNELIVEHGREPTLDELMNWKPGPTIRSILFAESHRLLPQAWLSGLLYSHVNSLSYTSFLLERYSSTGWWYYFPLAMLFKTPVATLIAGILTAGGLVAFKLRRSAGAEGSTLWSWLCLVLPVAVYGAAALTANINIGLRHILPVYPFLFITIGLFAARAYICRPKSARWLLGLFGAGLMIESAAAFPHYLSFFNFPSGGARGGIRLLGDSNLDWGQDLKLLKQWQQNNSSQTLYLSYFGTADPNFHGIQYINAPGSFAPGPPGRLPSGSGVIAVSATHLQGIYLDPSLRRFYGLLQRQIPIEVLGGSIYLYRVP